MKIRFNFAFILAGILAALGVVFLLDGSMGSSQTTKPTEKDPIVVSGNTDDPTIMLLSELESTSIHTQWFEIKNTSKERKSILFRTVTCSCLGVQREDSQHHMVPGEAIILSPDSQIRLGLSFRILHDPRVQHQSAIFEVIEDSRPKRFVVLRAAVQVVSDLTVEPGLVAFSLSGPNANITTPREVKITQRAKSLEMLKDNPKITHDSRFTHLDSLTRIQEHSVDKGIHERSWKAIFSLNPKLTLRDDLRTEVTIGLGEDSATFRLPVRISNPCVIASPDHISFVRTEENNVDQQEVKIFVFSTDDRPFRIVSIDSGDISMTAEFEDKYSYRHIVKIRFKPNSESAPRSILQIKTDYLPDHRVEVTTITR
jgi:hypothetical protein